MARPILTDAERLDWERFPADPGPDVPSRRGVKLTAAPYVRVVQVKASQTRGTPLLPMAEVKTRCYFRLAVDDVPGVFAQITRVLAEHAIGLASVIQREPGRLQRREIGDQDPAAEHG